MGVMLQTCLMTFKGSTRDQHRYDNPPGLLSSLLTRVTRSTLCLRAVIQSHRTRQVINCLHSYCITKHRKGLDLCLEKSWWQLGKCFLNLKSFTCALSVSYLCTVLSSKSTKYIYFPFAFSLFLQFLNSLLYCIEMFVCSKLKCVMSASWVASR